MEVTALKNKILCQYCNLYRPMHLFLYKKTEDDVHKIHTICNKCAIYDPQKDEKKCSKCKKILDLNLFPNNRFIKCGKNSSCYSCVNAAKIEYYKKNKDKLNNYSKEYYKKKKEKKHMLATL